MSNAVTPPAVTDAAPYRALRRTPGAHAIEVIDQRALPHAYVTARIADADAAALAIRKMIVRGAPLIGVVGAYGLALALDRDPSDAALAKAHAAIDSSRPTAVNLRWALDRVRNVVAVLPASERAAAAWREADAIAHEDVAINHSIGVHGLELLRELARGRSGPVNVMTHCNAGALPTSGWGTATAPIFLAHAEGLPGHVWISETRPRLQGANLTAWEMGQRGIPYTLFVDAASGLLLRRGDVDVVFVGADRVARNGDVLNKIGTYLKALAAFDNRVPFYVALPSPTIDFAVSDAIAEVPIEERAPEEVATITGRTASGRIETVALVPENSPVANYAFDVTPARLVTALITERGVIEPRRAALAAAFPERAGTAAPGAAAGAP